MRGRPSIFSPELADRLCERLADGETLRAICRDEGMPDERTVRRWALDDVEGFAGHYARAREIGYQGMADDLTEIADAKDGDPARDRLRVDTRKWLLSKALPKIYGEKQLFDHNVTLTFGDQLALIRARQRKETTAENSGEG